MKILTTLSLSVISLLIVGCSKDKSLIDYRREQNDGLMARITAVSGVYSGPVISKIDGTNLGSMTLKFQARTEVTSPNAQVGNEQNVAVSGSLSFKSLTSAELVFDNGFYDDVTGNFQVTIPVSVEGGGTSKLSLNGNLNGDNWNGTIEVNGQPDFGGILNLKKNSSPNTSSLEVTGSRLQQIRKTDIPYYGSYVLSNVTTPFKLTFINRDILPEQNFYKLFSPVRNVSVNCDFTDFELNFTNAIIDDKAGTLIGHDPYDQRGTPARANLFCTKFEEGNDVFGWDCIIQTKVTSLNLHLTSKK